MEVCDNQSKTLSSLTAQSEKIKRLLETMIDNCFQIFLFLTVASFLKYDIIR